MSTADSAKRPVRPSVSTTAVQCSVLAAAAFTKPAEGRPVIPVRAVSPVRGLGPVKALSPVRARSGLTPSGWSVRAPSPIPGVTAGGQVTCGSGEVVVMSPPVT